jgi:hypothetical protein
MGTSQKYQQSREASNGLLATMIINYQDLILLCFFGRDHRLFSNEDKTKGLEMRWKKHGEWMQMEDKDFLSPRWRLEMFRLSISNFARSLPFDWKQALVCWPIAVGLIVILISKHP